VSTDTDWRSGVGDLPTSPGVYLFKDRRGRVIYVGKAKNLRVRVRQYATGQDERLMLPFLLQRIRAVTTMVVRTEKEALILESTLIKEHRPRYNTRLVDDAGFLHLRVDTAARWPRFEVVREIDQPGARHFGPFASASRARSTAEFLHRRFPLRTCSDHELRTTTRPCLMHQMGRCIAPCADLCTPESYAAVLRQALLFLEGRDRELATELREEMVRAAEDERYEEAARLRDLISAVTISTERQDVAEESWVSRDIWGLSREPRSGDSPETEEDLSRRSGRGGGVLALVPVRRGRLREAVTFPVAAGMADDGELLSSALNTWYGPGREIPPEILLPLLPTDADALVEVLSERRRAAVHLRQPQRGHKARQLALAMENARVHHQRQGAEEAGRRAALETLQRICHLPRLPQRIECFDNSNIQGADPVAAQVVFIGGVHDRAHTRRYRVKTVTGSDDYATMREILGRRLRRGLAERELPDLLVVDGGRGQLSAALEVYASLGIAHQRQGHIPDGVPVRGPVVPVIGLAKPRTERSRGDREAMDKIVLPGVQNLVRLPERSLALRMLQRIRDAAHETAVGYHRRVRRQRTLSSALDEIPGLGSKRRKALLKHFGSVRDMKGKTAAELTAVSGVGPKLAERIHRALNATDVTST